MRTSHHRLRRLEKENPAPIGDGPRIITIYPGGTPESDVVAASGPAGRMERVQGETLDTLTERAAKGADGPVAIVGLEPKP